MFLIIKFNTRTTRQRMEEGRVLTEIKVLTEINIRELGKRKLLCLQISSPKRGNS